MLLPDIASYRNKLTADGTNYPLQTVTVPPQGLVSSLPDPPANKTGWPWNEQVDMSKYNSELYWPKLTIVTPSYNQADFLEQTIRSVLLQNYPNLEYIIIDGGSSDGSKEIIEKYSPWISYWRSEKDEGQSQAINMGFSLSSGDYHAWINSDDYYLQNIFELVIYNFIKHKTDFIYGYAYSFHVGQNKFELITVPPLVDYFIKIPVLAQPSCFWRSSIHQPVWEEMHCALDYELWLRLVKGNKRYRIREALSVANVHGDAKTSNPLMATRWQTDHEKMWSDEGHGKVHEWNRVYFLNRIRMKIYKWLNLL